MAQEVDAILLKMMQAFDEGIAALKKKYRTVNEAELALAIREKWLITSKSTVCPTIVDAIGNTPMVRLNRIVQGIAENAEILVKLEGTNPGSSIKDRIARSMIDDAESQGIISPARTTIVEISGGNTGVGLAMIAAARGYKCKIIIPDSFSVERRAICLAYGAEVILTPGINGIGGCIRKCKQIMDELGDAGWHCNQFSNRSNVQAHYCTTGPEIWEQSGGKVDVIVAGCGTGGTLTGAGRFLKEVNPEIQIFAMEPAASLALTQELPAPGPHAIQGIGPGFVPDTTDITIFDECLRCPDSEALRISRLMAELEGIACGISSGANVWAAIQIAMRPEMAGKRIVTVLPSSAERYLSTDLFKDILSQANSLVAAPQDDIDTPMDLDNFFHQGSIAGLRKEGIETKASFRSATGRAQ